MRNIFSERLRGLRLASALTMAQLAEMVGVIRQTISDFERGKITPSYAVLEKLADVFGCQVDYLMGREAAKPPSKWVADLLPDLEALDKSGREAVKALVHGLRNRGKL